MENERMTIVVPVRNRARLVVRVLDSIKKQTWRPLTVVVVDNASTDDTLRNLEAWKEANEDETLEVRIVGESEPGPGAARARGVEEVESRLMMHFDSDDIMLPGHVESIMRRFEAADYPDLVCFRVKRFSFDGKRHALTHKPGGDGMMDTHLKHCLLATHHYACETALLRRAGSWRRDLRCWEDFELGVRLLLESRRRVFIPDVNVEIYTREDSVTGTDFTSKAGQWEKALDAIEANIEKSTGPKKKKWLRYVAYRRAILAAHYKKEGNDERANALLGEALKSAHLGALQRLYLRLAYRYTAAGGRGAAIPARYIF